MAHAFKVVDIYTCVAKPNHTAGRRGSLRGYRRAGRWVFPERQERRPPLGRVSGQQRSCLPSWGWMAHQGGDLGGERRGAVGRPLGADEQLPQVRVESDFLSWTPHNPLFYKSDRLYEVKAFYH